MAANFRDLESVIISKASAIVFAVLGLGLGSLAYLKYKTPPVEIAPAVIKDARDPGEIARQKNMEKANQLVERRLYKSAEEILAGLYKEIPKSTQVLSLLALCEKKNGHLENAEQHLREAIALEPGQWIFHNNLGNLLFDKGKPVDALRSFDKALELSPKNHQILLSQGKVQELIGKFTDARLSYGQAIESGRMDTGTVGVVKDRLRRLDVLAYIERGDK